MINFYDFKNCINCGCKYEYRFSGTSHYSSDIIQSSVIELKDNISFNFIDYDDNYYRMYILVKNNKIIKNYYKSTLNDLKISISKFCNECKTNIILSSNCLNFGIFFDDFFINLTPHEFYFRRLTDDTWSKITKLPLAFLKTIKSQNKLEIIKKLNQIILLS